MVNELSLRHQSTHLKSSNLLTTDPTHQVYLPEPILDDVDGDGRIVVSCNREMKSVIPKKSSGKDKSRRSERVREVKLMLDERVLGVQNSVIKCYSSIKIVQYMFEET